MLSFIQPSLMFFRARFAREEGAVATEYGLLLVLVAIAIIAAATALGIAISGVFSEGCNSLGGADCGP